MRTTQVTNIVRKAAKVAGFKIGKVAVQQQGGINPITGKMSPVPTAKFNNNLFLHYCSNAQLAAFNLALAQHGLRAVSHIAGKMHSYRIVAA